MGMVKELVENTSEKVETVYRVTVGKDFETLSF